MIALERARTKPVTEPRLTLQIYLFLTPIFKGTTPITKLNKAIGTYGRRLCQNIEQNIYCIKKAT